MVSPRLDMSKINPKDFELALKVVNAAKVIAGDQLIKVIWFGSRVTGKARDDSDFDFVILGDFTESPPTIFSRLKREVNNYSIPVDYLPVTPQDFERYLFKNQILEEGVVLYER